MYRPSKRMRKLGLVATIPLAIGMSIAIPSAASAASCPTYKYTNPYIGIPAIIPTVQLSYGSTGACVQWLQSTLNDAQGYGLAVDGDFGPKTLAAVEAFQKKFLACTGGVDGIAGPKTDSCALADAAGGI